MIKLYLTWFTVQATQIPLTKFIVTDFVQGVLFKHRNKKQVWHFANVAKETKLYNTTKYQSLIRWNYSILDTICLKAIYLAFGTHLPSLIMFFPAENTCNVALKLRVFFTEIYWSWSMIIENSHILRCHKMLFRQAAW